MPIVNNKTKRNNITTYSYGRETTYILLPYANKILNSLLKTFKRQMNALGMAELQLPCLVNSKIFKRRMQTSNVNGCIFKTNKNLVLAPTAEEMIMLMLNKHMPKSLYQVQRKYRNEIRSNHGLLRSIEFLMMDCYI